MFSISPCSLLWAVNLNLRIACGLHLLKHHLYLLYLVLMLPYCQDSCVGDSGSGLMRSVPDLEAGLDRWDLIGVVSFGPRLCGTEGVPGVYARVNSYLDWILDTVGSSWHSRLHWVLLYLSLELYYKHSLNPFSLRTLINKNHHPMKTFWLLNS